MLKGKPQSSPARPAASRPRVKDGNISFDEASADLLCEKQPMLKFTTPDQIGVIAVFLCGEQAADITGVPLSIDGGWTAQ